MDNFRQYLLHIALAIYITATAIPLLFWGADGVFTRASAASIAGVLLLTAFASMRSIKVPQIVSLFFLLILFLFTYVVHVDNHIKAGVLKGYLQFFLIAGVGSLLVVNYKYNYELFLQSLIIVSLVIAPTVQATNYSSLSYIVDNDEWMGQIYAITPYLVGSIHYLFIGEKKIFKFLSVICLVSYFSMFIMHTPRGAVVTIVASIVVFIIQRMLAKGNNPRVIISWGILCVIIGVYISEFLLGVLRNLTDMYELRWLGKFVYENDISNNRYPLYQMAWKGFLESPFWGNGIASFNNFNGYPHNLFLQMLYETGMLMIIPFVYLLIKIFQEIFKMKKNGVYDYRFMTFFFLLSMNQLMFSNYFWKNSSLWMMIWMMIGILSNKRIYRKRIFNVIRWKYADYKHHFSS